MPLQFSFVHELPRAIQWPAVNVQYEHLLPKGFVESRLRGQLIDVSIFVCKVSRGYRKSDRPIEFSNYSDHRRGNVRRRIYFCVSVGMLEGRFQASRTSRALRQGCKVAREEGSFVGVVGECAEHRHHCEKQYASPSSLRAQLI